LGAGVVAVLNTALATARARKVSIGPGSSIGDQVGEAMIPTKERGLDALAQRPHRSAESKY
jgi:hypothetical protein